MIRRQGAGFNNDFRIAFIDMPDDAIIKQIQVKDLPKDWDNPNDYSKCQKLAGNWFNEQQSLVLKVPSAALSICNNYIINTIHPDFDKVKLIKLTPLMPDPRIDELLKKAK